MIGTAVSSKNAKNLLFHTKVEIQRLLRFLKISTVYENYVMEFKEDQNWNWDLKELAKLSK